MNAPLVNVTGLDHIVLMVTDADASLAFYRDKLGLKIEREDQWRAGEILFPSARIDDGTVIDFLVAEPTGTNLDHFAIVVHPDTDLAALKDSGEFDVVTGPNVVWGARGQGEGLYVRDPDGHMVELRRYPG